MSNRDQPNVVILTHGWTGSSVFAGLFGQVGYWLGGETVIKPDYNTFENAQLARLNRSILAELMPSLNPEHRFLQEEVLEVERRASSLGPAPLRALIAACEHNRPWLWKDPRLTWTIRVWARHMSFDNVKFLILTRDLRQAWITTNQRRHIQSLKFTARYNDGITQSNRSFLDERKLPYIQLSFEDLLLRADDTLRCLNEFFGVNLDRNHLAKAYRDPLGRKSKSWRDFVVASLIYIKNYGERDGVGRAATRMR